MPIKKYIITLLMLISVCYGQDSLCTLPVKFLSLKANLDSRQVKIEWQTEDETNNDHYEVEKSTDGKSFKKVSTVQINSFRYYYSFDELSQSSFYRVKQVDKDNRYSYSKTIFVNNALSGVSVSPNPFIDELNINVFVKSKSTYKVAIRNLNGQLISSKELLLSQGNNFIKILTDTMPKGMYIVSISNVENVLLTKSIVK